MDENHRKELLKLARETIATRFTNEKYVLKSVLAEFKEKRGVFVTLHKHGELRGCIGFILPIKSVAEAVSENALNAAFHDPRFPPVQKAELNDLQIEISLLTVPKLLEYKDEKDLLSKLQPNIDGVILEKNQHYATFLPQVWEDLSDNIEFLQHLCLKAGLPDDAWKTAKISVYQVEMFSE